eukprot:2513004-Prymnesium_polylepis.1
MVHHSTPEEGNGTAHERERARGAGACEPRPARADRSRHPRRRRAQAIEHQLCSDAPNGSSELCASCTLYVARERRHT